jgi:hypothetical protein
MEHTPDYFLTKGKNAEQYLYGLATATFLTDWCYLNPKLPNGKELCDLLIVFDDTVIIWQVKDLKLDENGRYKASEVEKNLRQLTGARRTLMDLKTPVGLENTRRFSETLDVASISKVFLISALLGEGEDFQKLTEKWKDYPIHLFTRDFIEIVMRELDTIADFCSIPGRKRGLSQHS